MLAKNEERRTAESAFENPAVIGYLVNKLRQQSRQQIGKTKIQKIVYLLTRKNIVDFDYSMHYYGPYSPTVAEELSVAETAEIIRSQWDEKRGFFLSKGKKEEEFEYLLEGGEKRGIDDIVDKYGRFNAKELTIIATYLFLEDELDLSQEDLVKEIHKIKNYRERDIRSVLVKAGIIH